MSVSLSYDPDQAYPLYYAVQKKLQGKSEDQKELSAQIFPFSVIPSMSAQYIIADYYASSVYTVTSEANADKLLHQLAHLDAGYLQNFIYRMKANILKMQHIHAMQHHHYDDSFPIFIDPASALSGTPKAAFMPNNIVDCDGIDEICLDKMRKENVLKSAQAQMCLSNHERALYLDHISEVREITAKDCTKDNLPTYMIGQRGVFARCDLPAHFFIGFYSGVYFDVLTDIVPFHDALGVGIELYLFGVSGQEIPLTSAYRFGNRISLVNSCTNYAGTAKEIAQSLKYQCNCLPMRFKIDNSPNKVIRENSHAFDINGYVTTRPIKAGAQIFVDYGYNYWRNKTPDFTHATPQEIADVFSKLR